MYRDLKAKDLFEMPVGAGNDKIVGQSLTNTLTKEVAYDIRRYYYNADKGMHLPTKSGLRLGAEEMSLLMINIIEHADPDLLIDISDTANRVMNEEGGSTKNNNPTTDNPDMEWKEG